MKLVSVVSVPYGYARDVLGETSGPPFCIYDRIAQLFRRALLSILFGRGKRFGLSLFVAVRRQDRRKANCTTQIYLTQTIGLAETHLMLRGAQRDLKCC